MAVHARALSPVCELDVACVEAGVLEHAANIVQRATSWPVISNLTLFIIATPPSD
jgi:C4-dicarboxylate transporter